MLARENVNEIITLLQKILDEIKVDQKFEPEDEVENDENKAPND